MERIFVLLPSNCDIDRYYADYKRGVAADRSPWGFAHAEALGYSVRFSKPHPSSAFARRLSRRLGCDVVHAWTCRQELRAADIVWTHMETEYLAAAFILRLVGARKPLLLGNTLWLFREFRSKPLLVRCFVRFCLRRVDLLTCNATPNLAGIGQPRGVSYVPYGISTESFPVTAPVRRDTALVIAVGNDRARDWSALREVATQYPDVRLRIASRVADGAPTDLPNVEQAPTRGAHETRALYRRAALLLVPVTENWHASGITVILEAVSCGTPVVAARQGGLDGYFEGDEILFYGPGEAHASAAAAVGACLADPAAALVRARRAQARFVAESYDAVTFIRRLVDVTASAAARRRAAPKASADHGLLAEGR